MSAPEQRRGEAKVLGWLVWVMEAVTCVVLAAMMLLTFIDVVGRYVLGAPVFGASEMIATMLAFVIFAGLAIANARDSHIVVELFDSRVRQVSPKVYDIVVHGFSILSMALIVYVLAEQAVEAAHNGSKTIVLEWPYAWITSGVATLAFLSIIAQVLGLRTGAYDRHGDASHLEDLP